MRDGGYTYLHACLLLLLGERPDHGYDLVARLGPLGLAGTDAAGTYRALRCLERGGDVQSQWTPPHGGPARRVYHLTPQGRAALADCGAQLRREQAHRGHFLARLESLAAAANGRAGAPRDGVPR
jgi:DNA-binding PadR family transcriptional regulator